MGGMERVKEIVTMIPDSNCDEDADEEVEFVKVHKSRVVHVQHVKHGVDLVFTQVCHRSHEHHKLNIYDTHTHIKPELYTVWGEVYTVQSHFSSDIYGFEQLQYNCHPPSIKEAVGLVEMKMTQSFRFYPHPSRAVFCSFPPRDQTAVFSREIRVTMAAALCACPPVWDKKKSAEMPHQICYSEKYFDDIYEYRYI